MMRAKNLWMLMVFVLGVSVAQAAVEPKTVGELTVEAQQIVIGDVIGVTSFWDEGHDVIRSRVEVAVDQYLVGEGTGTEVLEMSGGTVDDVTLYVSVLPVFDEGDHVLLFLGDSDIRLVQSYQGAFLTDGEQVVQMSPPCKRIIEETLQPLDALLAEIEAALPPGTKLPGVEPYQGGFVLPLGDLRYALCGYDWSYKANPMGENVLINPNCVDGSAGDATSQITQIQNGMSAWTNAGADFEFTYGGTSTQTAVSNNGTNLAYFDTTPPDGGGYIAATYIWAAGGNISECDLVFNDLQYTWWNGQGTCSSQMDIWNIATHEFGHFLCLADLYGGLDTQKTMFGTAGYCETKKRTLHQDDIDGIIAIYGDVTPDATPPTPNPMTFSTPPTIVTNHLYMIATEATDAESPPVAYYFDMVSGGTGGDDSGWITYTFYEDFGLAVNTQYTYRVKARDSYITPNETAYSANASTYTAAAVPGQPALSNVTSSSMDLNVAPNTNPSYTEFAVRCASSTPVDPTWDGQYVDASGNPSASEVWQTEALWDVLTIAGLTGSTEYCFAVKARNGDAVQTAFGSQACATTLPPSATVVSASSLLDHGGTELPLNVWTNDLEPRFGRIQKLELGLDDASGFGGGVTVTCTPTAYTGTVGSSVVGNTVTLTFSPGLPDKTACTIDLDCGATICVRNLEGDSNRDGVTNSTDNSQRKGLFGSTASMGNAQWDVNTSGTINSTDNAQAKGLFGNTAPACP